MPQRHRSRGSRSHLGAVMSADIERHVDFSGIRYAQCWEDADILLEALDVRPGHTCVSIASAGDNVMSLLSQAPGHVVALDLSWAQIACLELRVAAYQELKHAELLELIGSSPSRRRQTLYQRCRSLLSGDARRFWDANSDAIVQGIGHAGKFERYLALFRERLLPMVHARATVYELLTPHDRSERESFYDDDWNSWRWRLLLSLFTSRLFLGRLGRDPQFFRYAERPSEPQITARLRHAMTVLRPTENPYLQWILTGRHVSAFPHALREENFEAIRCNLDRLEWRRQSLEAYIESIEAASIDCCNLSDVFEYVSLDDYHRSLDALARVARTGCRLAYWNLFATRRRPANMADRLRSLEPLASELHGRDKAFFYGAFVIEERV